MSGQIMASFQTLLLPPAFHESASSTSCDDAMKPSMRFQYGSASQAPVPRFSLHRSTRRKLQAVPRVGLAPGLCASLTMAKPVDSHAGYDTDEAQYEQSSIQAVSQAKHQAKAPPRRTKLRGRTPDTRDFLTCVKLLLSGATAALVSRTVVAPLERVKMELVLNTSTKGPLGTALHVYQFEGVRGFWKGNALNVLRTAPFKASLTAPPSTAARWHARSTFASNAPTTSKCADTLSAHMHALCMHMCITLSVAPPAL